MQSKLLKNIEQISKNAGKIILKYYNKEYKIQSKGEDGPVTEADFEADKYIISELKKISSYPILSEETADDLSRMNNDYLWIVDPLDGTKNFISKNGNFSVSIGLAYKTKPILGVVHRPYHKTTMIAEKDCGAYEKKDGKYIKIHTTDNENLKGSKCVISYSKEPAVLELLTKIGATYDINGSASYKICLVANSFSDFYLRFKPNCSEWDTCASHIIIEEAGGIITDIYGKQLLYNQKEVKRLNGILASNKFLHKKLIEEISKNAN